MTTPADIRQAVARLCETLRGAGLPEATIEALSQQILQHPDVLALLNSDTAPRPSGPKFPDIKVRLADLEGKVGPILRRVSYAMSDADIDQAEIERYKAEVRDGNDPVRVTKRWIRVGD
jgi:hypothetical protein